MTENVKPILTNFIGPDLESTIALRNSQNSTIIYTSEIVSPMVIMLVLTVLLSHIVSTHGPKPHRTANKNTPENRKLRKNSASTVVRKPRKASRSNIRKRSISTSNSSKKGNAQESVVSTTYSCPSNSNTRSPPLAALGALNTPKPETSASNSSRKVFFEDESKSWTSSNSEKDEGIAEEILQESNEGENPTFREVEDSNKTSNVQSSSNDVEKDDKDDVKWNNKVEVEEIRSLLNKGHEPVVREENLRSNLRKRNVNKRCGTTGADCSSNNNESSTEDEGDVEDEEMRNKCEWTGVTTCSEDFEIEEQKSEDESEVSENHLHDHPFAWEFQNVRKISKT